MSNEKKVVNSCALCHKHLFVDQYIKTEHPHNIVQLCTGCNLENEVKSNKEFEGCYECDQKYEWPSPGYMTVTSKYGNRFHPTKKKWLLHDGVDIATPLNSDVVSFRKGIVYEAKNTPKAGSGIMLIIRSELNGKYYQHFYLHLNNMLVKSNNRVDTGEKIAKSGETGIGTGPHLHFRTWVTDDSNYSNLVSIDPLSLYGDLNLIVQGSDKTDNYSSLSSGIMINGKIHPYDTMKTWSTTKLMAFGISHDKLNDLATKNTTINNRDIYLDDTIKNPNVLPKPSDGGNVNRGKITQPVEPKKDAY